jgi:[citrate (pro-3S)-lyase] ligase
MPLPVRKPEETSFEDSPELNSEQNAEFRKYLLYLKRERVETEGSVGAIVMNCNPFTLGHRYLAERAAAEVEILYVFVVEEDRSFFKFDDRFALVREGLSDLKNVRALRSGKFIISTITFPGYFSKDSAKEVAVDTSLDLELFAKYIVPSLGIGVRFAGSEPIDSVTRQYNRAMKETLPRYGVKFVEFERTEQGGEPISASRVRALLDEKNFDAIKTLVQDVTYRYLRQKYGE